MGPIKATWTEWSTVKTRGESAVILRSASGVYRLGRPDDAATSLPLIAAAPHAAGDALEDGEDVELSKSRPGSRRRRRPRSRAAAKPSEEGALAARGPEAKVSATLAAARTDAGRVALIERLEEYERKFQAIPRELRATNYVRLNERVEYPREVSEKKRASQEARLARRCRAIAARNVLEERAVTRLHMETRELRDVRRLRAEELARTVSRMARYEGANRSKNFLRAVKAAAWTEKMHRILERKRRTRDNLRVMRATLLMVRFIRKTNKRHGLDRAVDCVLYVATLLKAQNGFRMACKKLCYCVTFTQRHWRKRAKSCDAHVNLCATQWKTAGFQEAVPMRKMTQLLVDHLRMKRQKHVMALVVYETYDLKPLLVEAVTSRGDRGPRTAVRTFVAETQKRGSMQSVAAEYGLDLTSLPPPKMTVLLEKDELQTLQDIAITQMEQELIRLLRGS